MRWVITRKLLCPAVIADPVKFDRRQRKDVRLRIMCSHRITVVCGRSKTSSRQYPISSDLLPFDVAITGHPVETRDTNQWLVLSRIRDITFNWRTVELCFIANERLSAGRIYWYDYAIVGICSVLRQWDLVEPHYERN